MPRYIDKIRVPVRLALRDSDPVEGLLSVCPHAELRDGPETLLDRLNSPTRVVPLVRREGGDVLLLVREHIAWVEPAPGVDPALVHPAPWLATREAEVVVRLLGGARHEGILAIEMPHEFNRVSDFMNGEGEFFPLRTPRGTILFGKSCVLDVRVRDASTMPRAA